MTNAKAVDTQSEHTRGTRDATAAMLAAGLAICEPPSDLISVLLHASLGSMTLHGLTASWASQYLGKRPQA